MTDLLIDLDSRIPNLALMHLSTWRKSLGNKVDLLKLRGGPLALAGFQEYAEAWISCVFDWNFGLAVNVANHLKRRGIPVHIGGSGFSLYINLPEHVESLPPDYQLYGDDRAIGFIQRGCIRKCGFCSVPRKEGRLADNPYRPLEAWVPDRFRKICLLDNEFAGLPYDRAELERERARGNEYSTTQLEIFTTLKSHDWLVSITQGYDIRLVSVDKAKMLADWKPRSIKFDEIRLYFSWDYFGIEPYVRQGIQRLLDAGFKGRELMCYCLVGFTGQGGTTHFQDLYRAYTLWKQYGVNPFIMRYNMRKDDNFLNQLARYWNRGPAIYRNTSFPDYARKMWPAISDEADDLWSRCETGEHPSYDMLPMSGVLS